MTLGMSLSLCWPLFLVCKTGTIALSYLAKNFEDEYIERGLHCHNELQIHRAWWTLGGTWSSGKKNALLPPPLKGGESREETQAKQTVWDLEIACGLQVPNPVIITTFLTRGRSREERNLKDRPRISARCLMVGALWQQLILQDCWPVGDQISWETPPQM